MTDEFILESLGLKLGDEITLLELDEKAEKLIDNEEILTPLSTGYGADEILKDGDYNFCLDENEEPPIKINFEIVKNTHDENSIIRIIR